MQSARLCRASVSDADLTLLHLRFHHLAHKLFETPSRFPSQRLANLTRVAHQLFRLGRPIESGIALHIFFPRKTYNGESCFDKVADGMRFSRGHDKVVRWL